ncbi:DUF397 domain-containing protein [Goodfellowiella coeruleoviolacea]|uniref:DUF397 domain-containing protein n=1 Tax=Goodfellowiella coeruleoviolacea TaxID=334858 RepID=UPI0020A56A07|nr:DUF397 domain-containing protein [Goodfellowiella coeruleoviolacea]
MPASTRWKKSSRSGQESSCVELAHTMTAGRDSKNPEGPVLTFSQTELTRFRHAVKAGRLNG